MGTSNSTPIMCTPLGAALYGASMAINITCGAVNVVGIVRKIVDELRYWKWNKHTIKQATNPVFYYHIMSLLHMFTHLRITGAGNSGRTPLNTETLTRKLAEETTTNLEVITRCGEEVLSRVISNGDQSNSLSQKFKSTWISDGPKQTTSDIKTESKKTSDGSMVEIITETRITKQSHAVNQLYVIAVGSEFQFDLTFTENVTQSGTDGISRTTTVTRQFTYWIRAMNQNQYSQWPDIEVFTSQDQPTAYEYLLNLKIELPKDENGQFDVRGYLLNHE